MTYNLPFEVVSACPKSFVVRLNGGAMAFISNECLYTLMRNPNAQYRVISHMVGNREMSWIEVAVFTVGFKPSHRFDCDGNLIR